MRWVWSLAVIAAVMVVAVVMIMPVTGAGANDDLGICMGHEACQHNHHSKSEEPTSDTCHLSSPENL